MPTKKYCILQSSVLNSQNFPLVYANWKLGEKEERGGFYVGLIQNTRLLLISREENIQQQHTTIKIYNKNICKILQLL